MTGTSASVDVFGQYGSFALTRSRNILQETSGIRVRRKSFPEMRAVVLQKRALSVWTEFSKTYTGKRELPARGVPGLLAATLQAAENDCACDPRTAVYDDEKWRKSLKNAAALSDTPRFFEQKERGKKKIQYRDLEKKESNRRPCLTRRRREA